MNDNEIQHIPLIGEMLPTMQVQTTHGPKTLPADYAGKWLVLFSHPADFTPVCTTEFVSFQKNYDKFRAMNTELLGLSVDQVFSHIKWTEWIKEHFDTEIEFPIIADTGLVAGRLGFIHPGKNHDTNTVRAVFVIDPEAKVRAILYYPLSTGRNFAEIKRLVVALQKSDRDLCATPADWQEGDDVIIPPASSCGIAKERMDDSTEGQYCLDWFLCFKKEK